MTAKPFLSTRKSVKPVQSVNDWIAHHLAAHAKVQVRLRGNILHVLCETPNTLHQAGALSRLINALLDETPGVQVITKPYPQVYQLYLYNRRVGQAKPDWSAPIYLNRLERHRTQYRLQSEGSLKIADAQTELSSSPSSAKPAPTAWQQDTATSALVLSNMSLARQGDPDAIAWYLSEVLSTLDVGVWVSVRAVPGKATVHRDAAFNHLAPLDVHAATDVVPRLWILCEAAYSPDPLLIAEPVSERLRRLSLTKFKDAVLVIQVHGEATPDWSLRIDLTPPEEMLQEWARWGDEGAIDRLINRSLSPLDMKASLERKDVSLHFIVQPAAGVVTPVDPPKENAVMAAIAPLLERLSPQGMHRAVVYGKGFQSEVPAWVRCLELPAAEHPALADAPASLAQQGDLPALNYLLMRLLNPDLEAQLATGGIRIQALRRDGLLHVMADAPVCPVRRQLVPPLLDYLQELGLRGLDGVRMYGRRAGQQRPAWSYGHDFRDRERLVPRAEPTFAASDAYIGDLLAPPEDEPLRNDLTPADVTEAAEQLRLLGWQQLRQLLIRTQLFVPQSDLPRQPVQLSARDRQHALTISFVWGLVGILLTLQTDWILGHIVHTVQPADTANQSPAANVSATADVMTDASAQTVANSVATTNDIAAPATDAPSSDWTSNDPDAFDAESLMNGGVDDPDAPLIEGTVDDPDAEPGNAFEDVFTTEGFTQGDAGRSLMSANEDLEASPDQSLVPTPDLLSDSPYASFRSQQLDEKLALYHERLQAVGPPDVLVIGSSRALRGIDPAALQQELQALGLGELSIFNFGVNGSTAQVVDLTLRRILTTDQLPRLILWADGARAFNSGRTDVTYNAIATSAGYLELERQNPSWVSDSPTDAEAAAADAPTSVGESLRDSYQTLDRTLSDTLGVWSAVHAERDQLKAILRDSVLTPLIAPITTVATSADRGTDQTTSDLPLPAGSQIDFDGFLALDVQFNPATYYQLYARVAGLYDSDYENFELRGAQVTAFQQLLEYTQSLNIPVAFVNTPLTDEYLDDYRMEAETDFQRMMLQFSASEEQFVFRDLGQVWADRYDYFSDPSHLNRYGAYQVSIRLAQDPMIPWPYALDPPVLDSEVLP